MPIYDYVCNDCKLIEEKMQKHSDLAPTCPKCGKEMKRAVSAPSFRVVGMRGYHKDTGDWAS